LQNILGFSGAVKHITSRDGVLLLLFIFPKFLESRSYSKNKLTVSNN